MSNLNYSSGSRNMSKFLLNFKAHYYSVCGWVTKPTHPGIKEAFCKCQNLNMNLLGSIFQVSSNFAWILQGSDRIHKESQPRNVKLGMPRFKLQLVDFVIGLQDYDGTKDLALCYKNYKASRESPNTLELPLFQATCKNVEHVQDQGTFKFRWGTILYFHGAMELYPVLQETRKCPSLQTGLSIIDMDIYRRNFKANGSKCDYPSIRLGHERVLRFIWQRACQLQHLLFSGICNWSYSSPADSD